MSKTTLTSTELVSDLRRLNPKAIIKSYESAIIETSVDPRLLLFPEGYLFDPRKGLIVSQKAKSKLYGSYVALKPNGTCW